MSTINNSSPNLNAAGSYPPEGEWMLLERAEEVTKKSIRTLKRYIKSGKLKAKAGKHTNSPLRVWITPELIKRIDNPEIFDVESAEVDFSPESDDFEPEMEETSIQAPNLDQFQSMFKIMAAEFAQRLEQNQEQTARLRIELEQKDIQLRLLPDLQKQMQDKETQSHIEKCALETQVAAMKEDMVLKEKMLADIKAENESLKSETEALKNKPSWWNWFLGKSVK
ncbi:MAG: hypothetical protein K2X29_12535 [Candidatus Obscuribacterales bacterium]|nr:hypothetical protein [Candidatus Obscuribacterales bacterium]